MEWLHQQPLHQMTAAMEGASCVISITLSPDSTLHVSFDMQLTCDEQ